ncbi:hypothetical protein CAEBREN_24954 [Caenorhabditis brenneri]|uniref:Uncharacterized protein n=1 Tax=Caenorhabditis brenneri TaxID=135651 RepID=G0N8E7_CAEBE|nr:hypothetical protein CAEBREN_24954 [Caenorhabditis brenneri]
MIAEILGTNHLTIRQPLSSPEQLMDAQPPVHHAEVVVGQDRLDLHMPVVSGDILNGENLDVNDYINGDIIFVTRMEPWPLDSERHANIMGTHPDNDGWLTDSKTSSAPSRTHWKSS